MPLIFISYRRDDTLSATGRLTEALEARFGTDEVFRDLDEIEAGKDFRTVVGDHLRAARVALIVIGRSWSRLTDAAGARRLDCQDDSVRLEIEAALAHDLLVIPVLVEGARMPSSEELPASLASLAYRNAHEISESRWHYDTGRLVDLLERNLDLEPLPSSPESHLPRRPVLADLASTLGHVPRDFVRLLYEPRRFLADRASGSARDLFRAWTFLIVSQLVAAVLVLQEWPTRSPILQFLVAPVILVTLGTFILSVPLYLSWRMVGAPREYRRLLVILVYQCAFVGLVESVAVLTTLIAVNLVRPAALSNFAEDVTLEGLQRFLTVLESGPETIVWTIGATIGAVIGVLVLGWFIATWGVYRETFHQSRGRSMVALVMFALCCLAPVGLLLWAAPLLTKY